MTGSDGKPENRLSIPYPLLAIIATLFLTLAMQTFVGVWWAAGLTKEVQATKEMMLFQQKHQQDLLEQRDKQHEREREQMQREIETQKVWIETTRERLAKVELSRGG